jgi:hypothetical protein
MNVDTVLDRRKRTGLSVSLHHTVGHGEDMQHAGMTYLNWYHDVDARDSWEGTANTLLAVIGRYMKKMISHVLGDAQSANRPR